MIFYCELAMTSMTMDEVLARPEYEARLRFAATGNLNLILVIALSQAPVFRAQGSRIWLHLGIAHTFTNDSGRF